MTNEMANPMTTETSWPVTHPPLLLHDPTSTGEGAFREAVNDWLREAMRVYLPPEVIAVLAAPLMPDTYRMELPIPCFGRTDAASRTAVARFGLATAVYKKMGASIFRRIHESYHDSEPAIVLFQEASRRRRAPAALAIGRLCILTVSPGKRGAAHPGDRLALSLPCEGDLLTIPPGFFESAPDAIIHEPVKFSATGDSKLCELVLSNCTAHSYYAPTLAPILPHAHVATVLARSVHAPDWRIRRRFGAGGVTFLLTRACELTPDLAIRLAAVAQRVDGLLGTLHNAAEGLAREAAALDAMQTLKHSVGNHLNEIATRANEPLPYLTILQRVLVGAVSYARREATPVLENKRPLAWNELGDSGQPFHVTIQHALWENHPNLTFSVSGLGDSFVDARLLVLIEELARNLQKNPSQSRGGIELTCDPKTGLGTLVVSGTGNAGSLAEIRERLLWQRQAKPTMALRGLTAVLLFVDSLRVQNTTIQYFLGTTSTTAAASAPLTIQTTDTPEGVPITIQYAVAAESDIAVYPFEFIFSNVRLFCPR